MRTRYREEPAAQLGPEDFYRWSRRWLEAEQDLAEKPEARVAAARAHLERMTAVEEMVKRLHATGVARAYEVSAAEFYRLEAEQELARAKGK